MSVFLIQTSGTEITSNDAHAAVDETTGPRFCDDILNHHRYVNASPYWKRDGFGRYDAWQAVKPGDVALLYCTSSVDAHPTCLGHVLPIAEKRLSEDRALLRFNEPIEITPRITHEEVHRLIDQGRLSDGMRRCGQQGFNFTQVEERDRDFVTDHAAPVAGTWDERL